MIDPRATGRTLGAYKSAAKKIGCSVETWIRNRTDGFKWCYRCRCWKADGDFQLDANRGDGTASLCKRCCSIASTASRYGIPFEDVKRFLDGGVCPICQRTKKLVVDHDHQTGAFRGAVCNRCNVGMGQFKDDPQLLRAAAIYLEANAGG